MENKIRITLVKSEIGSNRGVRATLTGLGLTKTNKTIIRKDTPELRGMIRKIQHLVKIEE